mmetsp:Transcript_34550/g.55207  ORF Transcript_34550/g.55207 Transcript_34550/m.55207 type:complete len:204 (+) Transcript_34550:926-1537(+)
MDSRSRWMSLSTKRIRLWISCHNDYCTTASLAYCQVSRTNISNVPSPTSTDLHLHCRACVFEVAILDQDAIDAARHFRSHSDTSCIAATRLPDPDSAHCNISCWCIHRAAKAIPATLDGNSIIPCLEVGILDEHVLGRVGVHSVGVRWPHWRIPRNNKYRQVADMHILAEPQVHSPEARIDKCDIEEPNVARFLELYQVRSAI